MKESLKDMENIYKIKGPAIISFSGGRTSGYMLYHILDAYDGELPSDVVVAFANTGKERLETLGFVNDCSGYWGVPINWLEYKQSGNSRQYDNFVQVDYESASRHGEPFDAVIVKKNYMPQPTMRFCTVTLKIEVMRDFCKSTLGWKNWTNIVGLRADEGHRVKRMHMNAQKSPWDSVAPMFDAGVIEDDVFAFWREQPFDLQLQSHEGNCDLCFLKSSQKISRILRKNPELAQWWIEKEEQIGHPFRIDRPKYKHLLEGVLSQQEFNFGIFDDETTCDSNACTD